jgi:DNA-binding transcriptional LysR family regulator
MYELPPLSAIRTFLVACRAGSFTAAAHELCVTHGAVSRQIQSLESWLGQNLFEKQGQRMVPTPHAQAFAKEMSASLESLVEIVQRYGKGETKNSLRVSVPTTFGMRWLIPRLTDFYSKNPDSNIQILTTTTQQQSNLSNFDIAIKREGLLIDGYQSSFRFLSDHHSVIAAPHLLKEKPLSCLEDFYRHTIFETETRPGHWKEWFSAVNLADYRELKRQRFDHFHVTLQGIMDGLGIGVGPISTLSLDIAAGKISVPFGDIMVVYQHYCASTPVGIQKTTLHRKFEDWLIAMGNLT